MSNNYRDEGLDFKRLALYFKKKIWIVLLFIVIGGGIGALGYQVVKSINMPIEYSAVSKLYIKFNTDPTGEVYQYYNGYTWNELLDSDPIMQCIMSYLPDYSKESVINATQADIISDIRLLTITVTGDNEKYVREIQMAVQSGLATYAIMNDELNSITTIKSIAPERIYWRDKTFASIVVGAILCGVISFFAFFFGFITDDAVYVQSDIEKRYPYKALGIMPRSQKGLQPYLQELKANLTYVMNDRRRFLFIDIDDHSELKAQDMERILNWEEGGSMEGMVWHVNNDEDDDLFNDKKEKEWLIVPFNSENVDATVCEQIKNQGGVVIMMPFGDKSAIRKFERIQSLLLNQDIAIEGIIVTDADEDYLMRYYS